MWLLGDPMGRLKLLVLTVLALLGALFVTPTATAATFEPETVLPLYAYDCYHYAEVPAHTAAECGPPATYDRAIVYEAADRRSPVVRRAAGDGGRSLRGNPRTGELIGSIVHGP